MKNYVWSPTGGKVHLVQQPEAKYYQYTVCGWVIGSNWIKSNAEPEKDQQCKRCWLRN